MTDDACGDAIRILLVEDDDALREAITRSLTKLGFVVTPAVNGADAVEAARTLPLDAVVMDVLLPDAGGLGVARELRRGCGHGSVPILFITALSLPAVRGALSPAPVLFKPFTRRQLLSSLREITRH